MPKKCDHILVAGKKFLIDPEDYDRLSKMAWGVHRQGYAIASLKWRRETGHNYMHRIILDPPSDKQVDHINGDKSDNRKCNLRLCTAKENLRNKSKLVHNTSGFKGVIRSGKKSWLAVVECDGKKHRAGLAETPQKAALLYDEKAKELFGEFARLNYAQ